MIVPMNSEKLLIKIASQTLEHWRNDELVRRYVISSAEKGVGEKKGSNQTPRGWHMIRAKIGGGQPINTIFKSRRPEGVLTPELAQQSPHQDWILTRILWLSGLELGKNRLGDCDTMQRYIYIHGCPDSKPMGIPLSKGCIRMRNEEIVALYDDIVVGTKVLIEV